MLGLLLVAASVADLQIPGWTAYLTPNPEAFQVSERSGVQGWNDPKTRVVWSGKILKTGTLRATVKIDAGFTITATETGGHDGHWFTVVLRAG